MTETEPMSSQQQGGGKKRRVSHKKPASKKVVKSKPVAKKPAPKKVSHSHHGGDLITDIKNLAVPFAILLAKQGIVDVFSKKKGKTALNSVVNAPGKIISSVAKSVSSLEPKAKKSSAKKRTVKKGGMASSIPSSTQAGKVVAEAITGMKSAVGSLLK